MHFATNNKEGTSAPNYLAKAKRGIQNWKYEHTCWISHTISQLQDYYIFPGVLERCNEWKRRNVLKNHKIHVCASLPLQTDSLDLLEELATHTHSNLSQNKLVSKDLLFKLSKLKHLIITESRFAVLLTDPGGQQPAAARQRLSGILFHQHGYI